MLTSLSLGPHRVGKGVMEVTIKAQFRLESRECLYDALTCIDEAKQELEGYGEVMAVDLVMPLADAEQQEVA